MALYALLRQESLFNASATSWVGARGLAQVMPATGEGIAQNLGITGYRSQDLYRPAVSVRFGAYYLGQQIGNMSGSLPGALAAYNGGLGNARRWAGGSVVADQDLFAEGIDFRETREYVKLVYGFQAVYRGIYQQEELP
jgi:soluble lytic murein transglycosylase